MSDKQATLAGRMIFHQLSCGKSILNAVQRARFELIKNFPNTEKPAWGLRNRLKQDQYDVVYLSGYAGIDTHRKPYFVMENEIGYKHQVFPDDLCNEELIENPTRLLYLSICRRDEK